MLTAYFAYAFWLVAIHGPFTVSVPWVPSLGLSLSFRLDGLSVLFATLITGIGTLVVLYAARYLEQHPHAGRFQVSLFAFMGSMLGVVLSDNLIALFVFWELTGFTSYLLIGFEHERQEARRAALQALLVTGAGGLALLAAAVMLWQAGGSVSLSTLLANGTTIGSHAMYGPIVGLVLLAAFTKSAQFPFHFWLPNAMQAPTPVSAYLHSATMVKAGVYLVARMTPLLGGSLLWTGVITLVGAVTMVGGAYRAVLETDLKRMLAYSTISALGVLMLLLGIGTREAVVASLTYLLAHACYKGALFLVVGAVEHETGTRDVTELGGLRRRMPVTAVAAMLAAGSMAGVPLLFGFVAKEQFYDSVRHFGQFGMWPGMVLVAAAVAASALLGAAGLMAGVSPFVGRPTAPMDSHEAPPSLWLGPLVLGGVGLVVGLVPALVDAPLRLAATAVTGDAVPVSLALWHGFNVTLLLSVVTLIGSLGFFMSSGHDQAPRMATRARHRTAVHARAVDARPHQRCRRARAAKRVDPFLCADHRRDGGDACRVGARNGPRTASTESLDADPTPRGRRGGADHRGGHLGGLRAVQHGGRARARHGRVWHRADLCPVRSARSGDDPVRGRDADRGDLRPRLLSAPGLRRLVIPAGQGA